MWVWLHHCLLWYKIENKPKKKKKRKEKENEPNIWQWE
jgi:hypothetical protein